MEREIDYNYETRPADLEAAIAKYGGLEPFLTFCQINKVEPIQDASYSCGAYINNSSGVWGCEMDIFSGLIFGIISYWEHPAHHHKAYLDCSSMAYDSTPAAPRPTEGIVVHGHYKAQPQSIQWAGFNLATGEQYFMSKPYEGGTDNISGFLSVVHGLAMTKKSGEIIYCDNYIVRYWIQQKQCIYNITVDALLLDAITRGLKFLKENPDSVERVINWDSRAWGPNPANFWRTER